MDRVYTVVPVLGGLLSRRPGEGAALALAAGLAAAEEAALRARAKVEINAGNLDKK